MVDYKELAKLAKEKNVNILPLLMQGVPPESVYEYLKTYKPPEGFFTGLGRGLAQGVVGTATGLTGLAGAITGTNLTPDFLKEWEQKLAPPEEQTFRGAVGRVIGNILPFIAGALITEGASVPLFGAKAAGTIGRTAIPTVIGASTAGQIYEQQPEGEKDLSRALIGGVIAGGATAIPAGTLFRPTKILPTMATGAVSFPLVTGAMEAGQQYGLTGTISPADIIAGKLERWKETAAEALVGGGLAGLGAAVSKGLVARGKGIPIPKQETAIPEALTETAKPEKVRTEAESLKAKEYKPAPEVEKPESPFEIIPETVKPEETKLEAAEVTSKVEEIKPEEVKKVEGQQPEERDSELNRRLDLSYMKTNDLAAYIRQSTSTTIEGERFTYDISRAKVGDEIGYKVDIYDTVKDENGIKSKILIDSGEYITADAVANSILNFEKKFTAGEAILKKAEEEYVARQKPLEIKTIEEKSSVLERIPEEQGIILPTAIAQRERIDKILSDINADEQKKIELLSDINKLGVKILDETGNEVFTNIDSYNITREDINKYKQLMPDKKITAKEANQDPKLKTEILDKLGKLVVNDNGKLVTPKEYRVVEEDLIEKVRRESEKEKAKKQVEEEHETEPEVIEPPVSKKEEKEEKGDTFKETLQEMTERLAIPQRQEIYKITRESLQAEHSDLLEPQSKSVKQLILNLSDADITTLGKALADVKAYTGKVPVINPALKKRLFIVTKDNKPYINITEVTKWRNETVNKVLSKKAVQVPESKSVIEDIGNKVRQQHSEEEIKLSEPNTLQDIIGLKGTTEGLSIHLLNNGVLEPIDSIFRTAIESNITREKEFKSLQPQEKIEEIDKPRITKESTSMWEFNLNFELSRLAPNLYNLTKEIVLLDSKKKAGKVNKEIKDFAKTVRQKLTKDEIELLRQVLFNQKTDKGNWMSLPYHMWGEFAPEIKRILSKIATHSVLKDYFGITDIAELYNRNPFYYTIGAISSWLGRISGIEKARAFKEAIEDYTSELNTKIMQRHPEIADIINSMLGFDYRVALETKFFENILPTDRVSNLYLNVVPLAETNKVIVFIPTIMDRKVGSIPLIMDTTTYKSIMSADSPLIELGKYISSDVAGRKGQQQKLFDVIVEYMKNTDENSGIDLNKQIRGTTYIQLNRIFKGDILINKISNKWEFINEIKEFIKNPEKYIAYTIADGIINDPITYNRIVDTIKNVSVDSIEYKYNRLYSEIKKYIKVTDIEKLLNNKVKLEDIMMEYNRQFESVPTLESNLRNLISTYNLLKDMPRKMEIAETMMVSELQKALTDDKDTEITLTKEVKEGHIKLYEKADALIRNLYAVLRNTKLSQNEQNEKLTPLIKELRTIQKAWNLYWRRETKGAKITAPEDIIYSRYIDLLEQAQNRNVSPKTLNEIREIYDTVITSEQLQKIIPKLDEIPDIEFRTLSEVPHLLNNTAVNHLVIHRMLTQILSPFNIDIKYAFVSPKHELYKELTKNHDKTVAGFSYWLANNKEGFIGLVENHPDVITTVGHEVIHILAKAGKIKESDYKLALAKYKTEEGIAEAFGRYLSERQEPPSFMKRIIESFNNFIEKITNFIRGLGFASVNDMFAKIEAGSYLKEGQGNIERVPIGYMNDALTLLGDKSYAMFRDANTKIDRVETEFNRIQSKSGKFTDMLIGVLTSAKDIMRASKEVRISTIDKLKTILDMPRRNEWLMEFYDIVHRGGQYANRLLQAAYNKVFVALKELKTEGLYDKYSDIENECAIIMDFLPKDRFSEVAYRYGVTDPTSIDKMYRVYTETKKGTDLIFREMINALYGMFVKSTISSIKRNIERGKSDFKPDEFNEFINTTFNPYITKILGEITKDAIDKRAILNLQKELSSKIMNEYKKDIYPFSHLLNFIEKSAHSLDELSNIYYKPFTRKGGNYYIKLYQRGEIVDPISGQKSPVLYEVFYHEVNPSKFAEKERADLNNITDKMTQVLKNVGFKFEITEGDIHNNPIIKAKAFKNNLDFIVVKGEKLPIEKSALSNLSYTHLQEIIFALAKHIDSPESEAVLSQLSNAMDKVFAETHYAAARRMFQRHRLPEEFGKIIRGYERDPEEVLSRYFTQMSNSIAHKKVITEYMDYRDKNKELLESNPERLNLLKKTLEGVTAPYNDIARYAYKLRMIGAFYYLSGRISSVVINLTQMLTQLVPELQNYYTMPAERLAMLMDKPSGFILRGEGKITEQILKSIPESIKATVDIAKASKDLVKWWKNGYFKEDFDIANIRKEDIPYKSDIMALRNLITEGIIESQFINMIREENLKVFGRTFQKIFDWTMLPFKYSEYYTRTVGGLLAFRLARAKGLDYETSIRFAAKVTEDVFGDYSRANRPYWMQPRTTAGALLAIPTTLKSYTFNYISWLLHNIGKRNFDKVFISLAAFAVFGGVSAIPFIDDLLDIAERIVGFPYRAKIRNTFRDLFDEPVATAIIQGIPAALGLADMSPALKMELPVPKGLSFDDLGNFLLGVHAQEITRTLKAKEQFSYGDILGTLSYALPIGWAMPFQAISLYNRGLLTKAGKPVIEPETGEQFKLTLPEAVERAFGFRPKRLADIQDRQFYAIRLSSWYEKWRDKIYRKIRLAGENPEDYKDIIESIRDYNKAVIKYKGFIPFIESDTLKQALAPRIDRTLQAVNLI